jgi:hypothetical protein
MNKTEQIKQGKAALHNCEGKDKLQNASIIIWPKNTPPEGTSKYYFTDKNDKNDWYCDDHTKLPTFTPSEIIAEDDQPKVKRYETKGGEPVELITENGRGVYAKIGYVGNSNSLKAWTKDNFYYATNEESRFDLIEITDEKPHKNPLILKGIAEELKMIVERLEKL